MTLLVIGLTIFCLVLYALTPYKGWLAIWLFKPVIDVGWSSEFSISGLRMTELIGAGLPAVVIGRMLLLRSDRPPQYIMSKTWSVYLFSALLGALMMIAQGDLVPAASYSARVLNGVLAFYSMQVWFRDPQKFKMLLIIMIIAGIFPMVQGMMEIMSGTTWRGRGGYGGQERISGVYHNSTNLRYYACITVTAIALYWVYFAKRGTLLKILFLGIIAVCAVIMFKVYSKAGFAQVAVAGLAWMYFSRKFALPAAMIIAVLIANVALDNVVFYELDRTFGTEFEVIQGERDEDRLMGGRVRLWKEQVAIWKESSILNRLIGGSSGGRGAKGGGHSDWIRSLRQNGFIGTLIYAWFLIVFGFVIMRKVFKQRTALNIVAAVLYWSWIIESIGLTPAVYTNFQWYVWGFIGLALAGIPGLEKTRIETARQRNAARQSSRKNTERQPAATSRESIKL